MLLRRQSRRLPLLLKSSRLLLLWMYRAPHLRSKLMLAGGPVLLWLSGLRVHSRLRLTVKRIHLRKMLRGRLNVILNSSSL